MARQALRHDLRLHWHVTLTCGCCRRIRSAKEMEGWWRFRNAMAMECPKCHGQARILRFERLGGEPRQCS
jgi:hypothetical protein